ncbi:MAG: DUF86 domain-containing protein [Bacteroidetes bacterium 4484_249]|nr:MAG: DUF86 domain-containing protein [Bacteroidetes bacterium 4484_249]
MPKHYTELLKHILDECNFIQDEITPEITKDVLIEDEVLKRAIIRSLEIIGEASKKIPADIKYKWKEIEWKNMSGMRNKLIHDYFGINYSIVWDVVKNKIPDLTKQIEKVIKENE